MFPETKVTEIYCMADDFCKELYCNKKNLWLKARVASIATNLIA